MTNSKTIAINTYKVMAVILIKVQSNGTVGLVMILTKEQQIQTEEMEALLVVSAKV